MDKTIKINGEAKIYLKPDTISLNLIFRDTFKEYGESLNDCNEKMKKLKKVTKKCFLESDVLKTENFEIDTKYENVIDEKNNYVNEFVGYQYICSVNLCLENDSKDLGKFLSELSRNDLFPTINISYVVQNIEKYKDELLEKAILNAKNKAILIAKNLDLKLGEIINIEYNLKNQNCEITPINNFSLQKNIAERCYEFNISAKEIEVRDNVNIIWEIK